jgi:hypothetical protein
MSANQEVAELIKVYFRNYTGDIQPARGQMAGQLLAILKETTFDKVLPLVEAVALDGMPLSRATLLMAAKKLKTPAEKPTNIPPKFYPDEYKNPFAIPMPQYVREALNRPRTTPIETETDEG